MKKYEAPEITKVTELRSEQVFAAHSWNNGNGNKPEEQGKGNGNGGTNYNNGNGNSNKWK